MKKSSDQDYLKEQIEGIEVSIFQETLKKVFYFHFNLKFNFYKNKVSNDIKEIGNGLKEIIKNAKEDLDINNEEKVTYNS